MRPGSVLRWLPKHLATFASANARQTRNCTPSIFYRRPGASAFVIFLFLYLALIRYCSYAYYRDPTSAFFDPVRGYQRIYSLERKDEAEEFIMRANSSESAQVTPKDIKMCVGIATVGREQEQYVRATVGSLLDGLTVEEREEIYLNILIAHTAPHVHPIYGEEWLHHVSEKVLLYDVSQKQFNDLLNWEKDKDYRKKAIFDYSFLLQSCLNTGAQWIAMIEDDTLAVTGWYPRAIEALEMADDKYPIGGKHTDWLYLRLFFTEEFLGWNSEEWLSYLTASIGVVGMTAVMGLLVRQFVFYKTITNTFITVTCLLCAPACVGLYFLAGRISMRPLSPGVYEMPRFGCCAQGFVFSREMAPRVVNRLATIREGFVDQIIEAWANEANLVRWVVIPSLLQHIGGKSSKGDDFGDASKFHMAVAEKIWNFGFELYDNRYL